jgi:hypothetical protein
MQQQVNDSYRKTTSEDLILDFDADGFVRWCQNVTSNNSVEQNHHNNMQHQQHLQQRIISAIGTWKLTPSGIGWNLPQLQPVQDEKEGTTPSSSSAPVSSDTFYYQFHANFHPNPFGSKPKMVRGIITQCHRGRRTSSSSRWISLRPVVGTFVGTGVGDDLYDVSFTERGLGLPKQLVTPTTTPSTTSSSSSSFDS